MELPRDLRGPRAPRLLRSGWFGLGIVAYVVGTALLAHGSSYYEGLLLVGAVYAILALSLDLVAGMYGLFSLGHAGLFAIGAYATTIIAMHAGWNFFAILPVVVVGVGVVGLVIGFLSLRVSGLYFAITTFIFTLIVNAMISDLTITGGYSGLIGPIFPNFPHAIAWAGSAEVWTTMAALFLTMFLVWSIRGSSLYPVALAVRDAEPFAASAGVHTASLKIRMFGLSAALAALAGWCFCFLGSLTPGQFNGTFAVNILVMVILGGMNTRTGPIVGALFVGLFPVVVSWNPLWQEVLFGAIFIFVIVFFPEGFVGLVARLARLVARTPLLAKWVNGRESAMVPETPSEGTERRASTFVVPRDATYALEARSIEFWYQNGPVVLHDVDLLVRPATIHGLIGPNGSGKSTLVNLISGQLRPREGSIALYGRRVERKSASARPAYGLARTFQTASMVREISTRDNVTIGLYHRFRHLDERALVWPIIPGTRREHRQMNRWSTLALRDVGLGSEWAAPRVADVPHGVEQLTQLAVASAGRPSILVLDEPLAGLSTGEVDQVSAILRTLRESNVTIIIVEHQTKFIFDVCDDVTVLAAGELVATGPASEVRANERVREVYLGQ
jgi:branched-chain amino acid transport system permease protein